MVVSLEHIENLRKIIQDEIKASQKETNNYKVSHTRDNSVEPPILSATIKVQDLQVQEEELIVESKQQVFEDTQLDEVDKIEGSANGEKLQMELQSLNSKGMQVELDLKGTGNSSAKKTPAGRGRGKGGSGPSEKKGGRGSGTSTKRKR
uniref:Uncharacterized protein n=1 Tax=Fagus sylvatica TaxID=28930 RepID=A0A2N9FME0_FAGSY